MKIHCIILTTLLFAGCASTPEPISSGLILNSFHVGQKKAEVLAQLESLGFTDDRLAWSKSTDGSERLVFSFVLQTPTAPAEDLGSFELLFSPDGNIQSGRKLNEEPGQALDSSD